MNTDNHILTVLNSHHPFLIASHDTPVSLWKECAELLCNSLPKMYARKQTWWYIHHHETIRLKRPYACAGDDEGIEKEFERLRGHGLTQCPTDVEDGKRFWCAFPHPTLKTRVVVATLTFKRFLGKEREGAPPIGAGLCPVMYALGILADGFTHVRAEFKVVKSSDLPKKWQGPYTARGQPTLSSE